METTRTEPLMLREEDRAKDAATVFGFWMYLMNDLVLFASLFAVYAVLRANTAAGPGGGELFSAPFVLAETILLLASSLTCGLSLLAARADRKNIVLFWLGVTAVLGACFVGLEFSEFARFIGEGHGWQESGFLSSYFALVGTHGLHVIAGLVWVVALMVSIARRGLARSNLRKLLLWSMFWHFLDVVWILIFTIVYLLALS